MTAPKRKAESEVDVDESQKKRKKKKKIFLESLDQRDADRQKEREAQRKKEEKEKHTEEIRQKRMEVEAQKKHKATEKVNKYRGPIRKAECIFSYLCFTFIYHKCIYLIPLYIGRPIHKTIFRFSLIWKESQR